MKLKIKKTKEIVRVHLPSLDNDESVYFEIQDLPRRRKLRIQDNLVQLDPGFKSVRLHQTQGDFERVAASIVGWKGLEDEDGKVIPFRASDNQTKEILDLLDEVDYRELLKQVAALSGEEETEELAVTGQEDALQEDFVIEEAPQEEAE